MTSVRLKIDPKERFIARFAGRIERAYQSAFIDAKKIDKLNQQKIATLLGVNRSVVSRRLQGCENMTQRTLAEMAWAMGYDIEFKLVPRQRKSEDVQDIAAE